MVRNKIYGPKTLEPHEAEAVMQIYLQFYQYPSDHYLDCCCAYMNYEIDGLACLDMAIDNVHAGRTHPRELLKHSRLTEIFS